MNIVSRLATRNRTFGLLCAVALAAQFTAQQQLVTSSPLSETVLSQQAEAAGPETDWNCLDIGIQEAGLRCIIPNYASGDPVYISQQKGTAKDLWGETYFVAGGNIGTLRDGGTIAGIEFSVFELSNPVPGPGSWQDTAELIGPDASGVMVHLGTLYLYGQGDWNARIAQLAAQMGGTPPSQYDVWRGATLHSDVSGISMRMQGTGNTLIGDAYSGDQLRLGGSNWTALGSLNHVGLYLQYGTGHQLGTIQSVGVQAQPTPFGDSASYLSQATAQGQFFNGDLIILNDGNGGAMASDGTLLSGVVYATGDVIVDGSYISASLTIVAGGMIDDSGSQNMLSYSVDGLLFWSLSTDPADAISIDGQFSTLTGALHAPSVELRIGGSNNSIVGRLSGARVKITGGGNVFSDGTD